MHARRLTSRFSRLRPAQGKLYAHAAPAIVAALLVVAGCSKTIPELPDDAPSALVFTRTTEYRHDNIEAGLEALELEGRKRGIRIVATEDPADFHRETLDRHRAVIFFNTTGDVLDEAQQMEFERYIQAGGGFVGIHAAADTEWKENAWPWYTRLVGAAFRSHPNTPSNVQEATVRLLEEGHPSTATLPAEWERSDEWYDYQRVSPRIDVLLEVDESTYQGGETGPRHPIAWFQEYDGGRSFYTGLGHTAESFEEDLFLDHLFGGLHWAMQDGNGPPRLDYTRSAPHRWRLTQERVVSGIGEPIAMEFSSDGDLWIVERRGRIRRWDPRSQSLQDAGELEVYSDAENGLVGITFAPDFATTRHGYLFYAHDDGQRPAHRLSRFEFRNGEVLRETEEILLSIPIDYGDTGHTGGDLQFDREGNLWISIGDDTNPQGLDGFAPLDENPERLTSNALRSSANSQDLRGKILRIHPRPDGSYTIPDGNLFTDPADGRPEIYAMGLRNPYRFSWDDEDGVLRWGEIGPDANEDIAGRGPRGYDEVNRTTEPGFFGWPLFVGANHPYRPWNFQIGAPQGDFFDPAAPRNDSPANTGLAELPPSRPAFFAYPYALDEKIIEVGGGAGQAIGGRSGRNALIGPVYRAGDFAGQEDALPEYYDGKILFYDFMREWVQMIEEDEDGNLRKIEPLGTFDLASPLDLVVGPDGALWILEYGSVWFADNEDSGISRISYFSGENPPPVAKARVSANAGATPFELEFDGSESFDRNPDDTLSYSWVLVDESGEEELLSTEISSKATLNDPGRYELVLRVEDTGGTIATAREEISVGNDPPRVLIEVDGNRGFILGEELSYRVVVTDTEDGNSADGSIDAEDIEIRLLFEPAGFETTGHGNGPGDGMAALAENGCTSCHSVEVESAGPAWKAIAQRYAADPGSLTRLAAKVRAGGSGSWGGRDMPANPHLAPAAAERLVDFILDMSPDRVRPAGLPLKGTIRFDQHSASVEENPFMGPRSAAEYRLEAAYRDRGTDTAAPLATSETLTFSWPNLLAADFDEGEHAMVVHAPEGALTPEGMGGEAFLVGTRDNTTAHYRDIDLTGIRTIRIGGGALSAFMEGGAVEVHLDTADGELLGTHEIEASLLPTASIGEVDVAETEGIHDIVLVFRSLPGADEGPLAILLNLEFSAAEVGSAR